MSGVHCSSVSSVSQWDEGTTGSINRPITKDTVDVRP